MSYIWRSELRRILALCLSALVFGYYLSEITMAFIVAAVLYIALQWLQLYRLYRWLYHEDKGSLPDSTGIWGAVFQEVERLRKRSQKHRQRLQTIINRIQDSTAALQDAVLMVDSHGNLEWWNRAADHYLGLKSPVDVGQPITNLIRNPEFKEYFDAVDYSEPLSIASPIKSNVQLQFSITLFGRKDRLILVHDITRLKHLEQMRKDFVANVSHELRTPLTVLSGYIETMEMAKDSLPPRWGRMLSQMGQQSERMGSLIKDLLMLSRLETTQKDQPKPVAITPLLERITADARALALSSELNHRIELDIHSDDEIKGYSDELRSAFSNLAFNAVKYTPEGGHIKIRWFHNKEGAWFCVKDNGVGIEKHHQPRLTERFYRADPSRSQQTGGTGLGLAIVKHVLLRHDAQLVIKSELGEGSTFCCHFSLQRLIPGEQYNDHDHPEI